MGAAGRAKDRAAKRSGRSVGDYKYNPQTNTATLKEDDCGCMNESMTPPSLNVMSNHSWWVWINRKNRKSGTKNGQSEKGQVSGIIESIDIARENEGTKCT